MNSKAATRRNGPDLAELFLYFARVGATSFGGTVVIAERLRKDLVEREWIDQDQYLQALAFAQLSPGPLVPQLAMYLGFLKQGTAGATVAAVGFAIPSFSIVLLLAQVYVRSNGIPQIQSLFYGVGAAVIAIIAQSAYRLCRATLGKELLYWFTFAVVAALTAFTRQQVVWWFLGGGALSVLLKSGHATKGNRSFWFLGFPPALVLPSGSNLQLLVFFAKAGLFVFGSGFAIVPLLHNGIVQDHHWLTETQFLDAVAIGLITPGPVVIIAAFVGFIVGGFVGALAGTIGVFLPIYLFVIFFAPHYERLNTYSLVRAFIRGVTAAVAGAIMGTAYILGQKSIHDWPTSLIATATFAVLLLRKNVPEPLLVVAAGLAGLLLHPSAR